MSDQRKGAPERGAATVLAAGLSVVLAVAATIAVLVASAVLATHKARAAADLSALAAATAMAAGYNPCLTAEQIARENGAVVVTCRVEGSEASFVVAVTVSVPTGLRSPLPEVVHAEAHAGNVSQ